jgi:aryl-alcohol dehydrogenase-like predicted oxidoreductase
VKTRRFGRKNWQVSEIGYGAWQIGGNMWGSVSERDAEAAIEAALDAGINFFDTARAYGRGRSEQVLGRVLRQTGMRERVRVATKVPPMNGEWPASHESKLRDVFPAQWIRQSTGESIANLGFAPDLQQLHVWSDAWVDDAEWSDVASELKQQGSFTAFGVSVNDHEPASALRVTRSGRVDSVQVIYNIFDPTPEQELFPVAAEHDVAVIVRVSLDEGSLGGRLTRETKFDTNDMRIRYFRGERLAETVEHVEQLRPVLERKDQTLAQGALRFCLSAPEVTTVIVGSVNPDHIRANAAVSDRGPLDAAAIEQLRQHAWPRNFYH